MLSKGRLALTLTGILVTAATLAPTLSAADGYRRSTTQHDSWIEVDDGNDGDAYALIDGDSSTMSGSYGSHQLDRFRDRGGRFVWFRLNDREYVIRDAAAFEQARRILAPQRELGRQQGILGREQGELGRRQGELGREQGRLGREQARIALDRAYDTDDDDRASRDRARAERDELRQRTHSLAEKQRELGDRQRELGDKQRELGDRQRELGRRQREASREARPQLRRLFEESIRNGRAQEVR